MKIRLNFPHWTWVIFGPRLPKPSLKFAQILPAVNMAVTLQGHTFGVTSFGHSVLGAFSALPGGWIAAAAAAAALWVIFRLFGVGSRPATVAEVAMQQMPALSMTGPMVFMAAGVALTSIGMTSSPSVPVFSEIVVAGAALDAAMVASGANPADRYRAALVSQTNTSAADQVAIVSPSRLPGNDVVSVYSVRENMQIASQGNPEGSYISFFVKDSNGNWIPSIDANQALRAQMALAKAAHTASSKKKLASVKAASAANKHGTLVP